MHKCQSQALAKKHLKQQVKTHCYGGSKYCLLEIFNYYGLLFVRMGDH
jgi:hypothetical protein